MNAANPPVASQATPQSPGECANCGCPVDWSAVSWCPSCGYYPAVGALIEGTDDECDEVVYENWWEAVPRWMWVLAGGLIALFFVSIIVRLVFAESPVRLWWTLAQMGIGFIAFCVAHLLAYLYGAAKTDGLGPLDAFVKPIATWHPVLFSLPHTCRIVCTGAWSLAAIVLAFFIIDGIDFDAKAQDPQQEVAQQRRKRTTNPMAYMIRSAQKMAKAQGCDPASQARPQSLEDALGDFTGQSGVMGGVEGLHRETPGNGLHDRGVARLDDYGRENEIDLNSYIEQQQQLLMRETTFGATGERPFCTSGPSCPPNGSGRGSSSPVGVSSVVGHTRPLGNDLARTEAVVRPESIECVVFGYTTNIQGDPRSLLLAAPDGKRLRFVAKVPIDDVAPDIGQQMAQRFYSLHQRWPMVRSPYGGRWLKPELFCLVEFSGWTLGGRLSDPYVTRLAVLSAPEQADSDFPSAYE